MEHDDLASEQRAFEDEPRPKKKKKKRKRKPSPVFLIVVIVVPLVLAALVAGGIYVFFGSAAATYRKSVWVNRSPRTA